jgi:hypothetical protein
LCSSWNARREFGPPYQAQKRWCKPWPIYFWKHSAGTLRKARREALINPKITPDRLSRGAVVYVRQSTMGQVIENTESQRRQYALAESARARGFVSITVIDDDLGRSGSCVTSVAGPIGDAQLYER